MTSPNETVDECLTARPHYVALPYRADGVARALRQTYPALEQDIPQDMLGLLTAIDQRLAATVPR